RHESVECLRSTRLHRIDESRVDESRVSAGGDVENLIADGNADSWRRVGATVFEDTKREILNRKVRRRVVRRLHPRFERRVVRVIETHTEVTNRNSSTGSRNEHDPNATATCSRTWRICDAFTVNPFHEIPSSSNVNIEASRSSRSRAASAS